MKKRKEVHAKAQKLAEERVLDALVGNKASVATRESFLLLLRLLYFQPMHLRLFPRQVFVL